MDNNKKRTRITPSQLLVLGFVTVILLGAALLKLPYSTTHDISTIDALFTSTSAVCVTGLIVRSTPTDFTTFGRTIILLLIQIGGLGYMSMATFLALLAGRKIGVSEKVLLQESLNTGSLGGIVGFMKGMIIFVLLAEGIGTALLYFSFLREYPPWEALWQGVFHSISAFNNAGFSLLEDGLARYRGDGAMNLIVMTLIVLGGIGFVVVDDLYARLRGDQKKLMLHTLIVLVSTTVLTAGGAFAVYFSERKYLFADADLSGVEVFLSSLFASVTSRTAGFSTIDYSLLQPATVFLLILLMMIGASPGSTGGGIKTTTFSVVIMHLWCTIRGKRDTVIFSRRIPEELVSKSLVVLALAMVFVPAVTFVIVDIEHSGFQKTMFEVVSAFGTVGLSSGDGGARSFCAGFSGLSKGIIILTMLAGRLGPLTLFTALLRQREERIRYAEGRIMVG